MKSTKRTKCENCGHALNNHWSIPKDIDGNSNWCYTCAYSDKVCSEIK